MSIALHIERLVIDEALLGGERAADVRVAIERELARQLMHPGARQSASRLGVLATLPAAVLPPVTHPREQLGTRIAMAVGQRLDIDASPTREHGCVRGSLHV